jgi:hypothetical protein
MSLTKKKWETYQNEKGRWFSPGIPVSSTNKTDHHDVESGVKQHNPNQTYKPFVDE